ncbi:MAG: hypothetical protein WCV86_01935 [Patescibacteria group bacterium]|jgi:dipeptidyl aminopeptidase/acylaminoacyl peptidase
MERELSIPIPKTKMRIYGKLRGNLNKPLIILVHGLHSSTHSHRYYNAERYFNARGYATFTIRLCGSKSEQRKLHHTTLKINAEDLDTAVRYFKKQGVKRIAVVGSSYSGPSILLSDTAKFFAIILLDPSYKLSFLTQYHTRFVKELNAYLLRGSDDYVIGKKMVEESENLDWDSLTSDLTTPLLLLMASNGALDAGGRQYLKEAKGPKKLITISRSDHGFNREGNAERVYAESAKWLKKYI